MTPSLKLFPSSIAGPVPRGHLDAAAADVDDHGDVARHADAIDGGEVYQPGFLRSGNDARRIPVLLCDRLEELAAFSASRVAAGCNGDNLINLMRFGQTPEFRQHLERGAPPQA